MAQDAPQDSAGPSSPPPTLPEGWLAQWEGVSRKWYFVQRSTGKSQWEVPTEAVVLTPSTTPNSIGSGPSRTPLSRPQTNSPQAPGGMADLAAARGFPGTDRAGISSFSGGSQGNPQLGGFTHLATGMLNRISNQLIHDKPDGYNQQMQQGHPGQAQAYGQSSSHGLLGHLSHFQNNQQQTQQNPYGYTSTGQLGSYAGAAPQYHPAGQSAAISQAHGVSNPNGGSPHPVAGLTHNYAIDQSGTLSSQFNPSSAPAQHYSVQQTVPTSIPNQFQDPTTSSPASASAVNPVSSSVAQPQWQLASQPPIPQSTKPLVAHPQQPSPNPTGLPSQQQFNQQPTSAYTQQQQQHLNQSFANNSFPSTPYTTAQAMNSFSQTSTGQPFLAQPVDSFGQTGQGIPGTPQAFHSQGMPGLINQHSLHQSPTVYQQNPQYLQYQGGQQGSPFATSSSMSAPPATTSAFGNNSPMGTAPFGAPHPTTQPGSLSTQPSSSSLNANFSSTGPQTSAPSFVAELPDNQIAASHYQHPAQSNPSSLAQAGAVIPAQASFSQQQQFAQQQQAQYQFMNVNELPGSDLHRPAMSDPQFVSGPWTASSAGGSPYPQQARYGPYGGGFR